MRAACGPRQVVVIDVAAGASQGIDNCESRRLSKGHAPVVSAPERIYMHNIHNCAKLLWQKNLVGLSIFNWTRRTKHLGKLLNIVVSMVLRLRKSVESPASLLLPGGIRRRIHLVKVQVLCVQTPFFLSFFFFSHLDKREKSRLWWTHTVGHRKLLNLSPARFQKAVLIVFTQHKELKEIDSVFTKATHSSHLHGIR